MRAEETTWPPACANRSGSGRVSRCLSSAVLEPGEALSFANAPLAAVGTALANDEKSQDRAVAEILRDVDMDAALAELLNGQ